MLEQTPIDPTALQGLSTAELASMVRQLEALHRQRCRTDLRYYAANMEVPGAPANDADIENDDLYYPEKLRIAAHHDLILSAVQEMIDGPPGDSEEEIIDGIIIMEPPGSAKSTYGSVVVPSFLLGRPGTDVIATSYGDQLVQKFARRTRKMVRSQDWLDVFDATITGDNQAIDDWSCTNGSTYRAGGILAGITGNRADFLIVDDPIKGRQDADSEIIREKVYAAWQDDLQTRLKPGGKVILIGTRWHQDDLIGRVLGEEYRGQSGRWRGTDGRNWWVINLPMIAEHPDDPLGRQPGEMLWPEWFKARDIERIRLHSPRTWSALYQQRPSAEEGAILKRAYWRCWPHGKPDPTPEQLRFPAAVERPEIEFLLLSYDTALEADEDSDYSAMTAWGLFRTVSRDTRNREFHQTHVIMVGADRARLDAADLLDWVEGHIAHFRPTPVDALLVEKRASGYQLIQEMQKRRWPVIPYLPRGKPGEKGKVPRAKSVSIVMDSGTVWYMPGKRTLEVIDECAMFPNGTYDDWVDTVTQAIDWARTAEWWLEIPSDRLTPEEEAEEEARQFWVDAKPRQLYAASGKRFDSSRRRLYG